MNVADVTNFVQYGILGLVVLAAISGLIWFKPSVDALKAERDRVVSENEQIRKLLPDAIAINTQATMALNEAAKAMRDMTVVAEVTRQTQQHRRSQIDG